MDDRNSIRIYKERLIDFSVAWKKQLIEDMYCQNLNIRLEWQIVKKKGSLTDSAKLYTYIKYKK